MAKATVPEKYWVYKITCLPTGKGYIGFTNNVERRHREHRNDSTSKKLRAAYELYDEQEFLYEILCECVGKSEGLAREREMIAVHKTGWPLGYNVVGTGKGAVSAVATKKNHARRQAAQRMKWDDPAHRVLVSQKVSAFWADPVHKEEMRRRAYARWDRPDYVAKQKASHWGKCHSEETRQKLREVALARHAAKRALRGEEADPQLEGTRAAWLQKEKAVLRKHNRKAFWASEAGLRRKEALSLERAERNRVMWSDPDFVAGFKEKMTGRRNSAEVKKRMSDIAIGDGRGYRKAIVVCRYS